MRAIRSLIRGSAFRRLLNPLIPRLSVPLVFSTRIDLSWTAVTGATGYNVYDNGVLLPIVGAPVLNAAGVATANKATLTWSAVTGAVGYNVYRNGTVIAGPPVLIAAPVLNAANVATGGQAGLSWAAVTNAVGYNVYRNGIIASAAVPDPPTGVTATGGVGQATITFTVPASNGSAITGYTARSGGLTVGTGTSGTILVTGLAAGTGVTFTVSATNAIGPGAASAASNAVTITAPATVAAPVLAAANVSTPTQAILTWGAVSGATGYNVYRGGVLITTPGAPNAPTALAATGGQAAVTLTWTTPASNGSPITSNIATSSGQAVLSRTVTTSPALISGLVAGAYVWTLQAVNAAGAGPSSAPSGTATVTPPTAPVLAAANVGTPHQATLTWATVSGAVGYNVYRNSVLV